MSMHKKQYICVFFVYNVAESKINTIDEKNKIDGSLLVMQANTHKNVGWKHFMSR